MCILQLYPNQIFNSKDVKKNNLFKFISIWIKTTLFIISIKTKQFRGPKYFVNKIEVIMEHKPY